jgi:hypothetical protein
MTTLSIFEAGDATGVATVANATRYGSIVGRWTTQSSEQYAQTPMREAGTMQNFYCRVTANTITNSTTLQMRKDAGNASEAISITSSTSGEYEDTVNTDTIAAGSKYNTSFSPGADTTHTLNITIVRTLFSTTTNTATRFAFSAGGGGTGYTAVSTTYYNNYQGSTAGLQTTEAGSKCRQRKAGTMYNLFALAGTGGNSRTTTTTMGGRIDTGSGSANGNLAISILAAATGMIEDNVNNDAVAVGNDYNIFVTTGSDSGHTVTIGNVGLSFVSTAGYTPCILANAAGFAPNSTTRNYYPLSGHNGAKTTTEANVQTKMGQNRQFSNLTVNLSANSTGTSTQNFRVGASSKNQVNSISASSTGNFTDTVNVDYVVPGDEVNYAYTPGAASGVTIQYQSTWAVKGYLAALTDTVSLAESVSRKVVITAAKTDTLSLADTASRKVVIKAAKTDTLSLAEAASRKVVITAAKTDTLTLTEGAVSAIRSFTASISDTLSLAESLSTRINIVRALTDGLSLSEAVSRTVNITSSIAETLSLVEQSIVASINVRKLLTDTLSLAETSITGVLNRRKLLTDTLSFAETSVSRQIHIFAKISETLSLLERFAAIRFKRIFPTVPQTKVVTRDARVLADIFHQSLSSSTNIFPADLVPTHTPISYFHIACSFADEGFLTVVRRNTKTGVMTSEVLNNATVLVATADYKFTVPVSQNETINLRYTRGLTTILKLLVLEEMEVEETAEDSSRAKKE